MTLLVTFLHSRPRGQKSHRTLPAHVTQVPRGHGVAEHMPADGQMLPMGQSVWLLWFWLGQ